MTELGRDLHFALEARQARLPRAVRWQQLDRGRPPEHRVAGTVDNAHTAGTDLALQHVLAEAPYPGRLRAQSENDAGPNGRDGDRDRAPGGHVDGGGGRRVTREHHRGHERRHGGHAADQRPARRARDDDCPRHHRVGACQQARVRADRDVEPVDQLQPHEIGTHQRKQRAADHERAQVEPAERRHRQRSASGQKPQPSEDQRGGQMVEVPGLEHEIDELRRTGTHERRRDHVDRIETEREDEHPASPQAKTILKERALRFGVRRSRREDACDLDFHWTIPSVTIRVIRIADLPCC